MTKAFGIAAPILFVLAIMLALGAICTAIFAVISFNFNQPDGATCWMSVGLFFEFFVRYFGWWGLIFGCGAIVHRLDLRGEKPE